MTEKKDLVGQRFGRWQVVKFSHRKETEKYNYQYWYCICDCGESKIVEGTSLRKGSSVSCGCYKREMAPKGEGHYLWRKSHVEYHTIHAWLRKHFGKPSYCEGEDCRKKSTEYQWALKRGFKYERKRENFIRLCRSCHSRYDKVAKNFLCVL